MASCVSTKPARAARSHVCTYAPRNENQVRHGLVGLVCFFIRLKSAIRISHLSSLSVPLGHDMPKGRRGNPLSKVCIIRRPRRRRQDMQCVCVCVCASPLGASWTVSRPCCRLGTRCCPSSRLYGCKRSPQQRCRSLDAGAKASAQGTSLRAASLGPLPICWNLALERRSRRLLRGR